MPRNKIFIAFIFVVCCSVVPVQAGTLSTLSQGRYGGVLVLAVGSDPKTFNDIVASDANSSTMTSLLFEGLTRVDPVSLKVIPDLAVHWQVSADGTQWTFYLRKGVRWSDGQPLTADDVIFTFNDLIYNPDVPSPAKDVLTIAGKPLVVQKINDYTVRFILPVKFAPFLQATSQPILPKHCLAQAVREKKFPFTWGIDTPPREIVGTGPFMLQEYRPGERLVFVRNPHYWKKSADGEPLPYLDKVIFLIIPDPQAQMLKFIDGELDEVAVSGMDYPLLKSLEHKKGFRIYDTGPDFGSNFLAFNQNPRGNPTTGKPFVNSVKLSWFTNLAFRKAVAHAIDKQKIIQILFNGFGVPQDGPMSPSSGFFYNSDVVQYDYNLDKARDILRQAGFVVRHGVLQDSQGHPVKFNLYTNAGGGERLQIAAIIRSDLERLGMTINFTPLEFNTLVNKLMSSYDWDAVLLGLTGGIEPHFGQNVWYSSGGLHLWDPREPKPATAWEKRLDEIFDQGAQELDRAKRKKLYDEFQRVVADELPVMYTVLAEDMFAVRNKFGNLKPTAYGGAFYNIEEIYLKKAKHSLIL